MIYVLNNFFSTLCSQISDKGCLLTLSVTTSVTVGSASDLISYERRLKSVEAESRELMKDTSDRTDGSMSSSSNEEVKRLVDQVQALTKQNKGWCLFIFFTRIKGLHYV